MKKLVLAVFISFLFMMSFTTMSCSDKRPVSVDSTGVNASDTDTTAEDSAENIIAETPMPKAADELFDDFIFNFAANKKLQYRRIVFPLEVYRGGKVVKKVVKSHWPMEHFF